MHIRCPHCQVALDVVADESVESMSCPSCGVLIEQAFREEETVRLDASEFRHLAHYQLLELVGQGAFGVVWKARDTRLDRIVALKLPRRESFDESTFDRFVKEARAAAQGKHKNIVSVYEIGRDGPVLYIACEFIDGHSLRDILDSRRFNHDEAAELVITLAEAVHQAHEAGVVHRDLKPANVLIDRAGEPHLTDFGMAKRDAAEITVTADGQVLGTMAYMSPEQARGESHLADRRSDVYSLGVMLYELLCGERPFRGRKSRLLLYQVLHDEPLRPRSVDPSIPRDLETICLKAMQKEPEKRYATAQELADDLRRFQRGEPIQARPVGHVERTVRWGRRNPALSGVITVAVTAMLAAFTIVASVYEPPHLRRLQVETDPPGATLAFYPLDPTTGEPQPGRAIRPRDATPFEVRLPPGEYLVVAVSHAPGYSFHEVYRTVPEAGDGHGSFKHNTLLKTADGAPLLPPIEIPRETQFAEMVAFPGSERFTIGSPSRPEAPPHLRSVPGFLMDVHEVTVGEFRQLFPGPENPSPSGAELAYREHGIAPDESEPLGFVSWDEAVNYAERVGKRLPEEWEYEFAATWGGTRTFPWGDDPPPDDAWRPGPAGAPDWDRLPSVPPVVGLFSNVAEWTCSWPTFYPMFRSLGMTPPPLSGEKREVRGAPYTVVSTDAKQEDLAAFNPCTRFDLPKFDRHRLLGFRCVRSLRPRLTAEDFGREISE